MKNKLMTIMLIATTLFTQFSFAQNLVPNFSFEDTIDCPQGIGAINLASGWATFRQSPDYFNSCNGGAVSTPLNLDGFQYPHLGNAYAGIVTYAKYSGNFREYMGVQLLQQLNIGSKYFVSFFTTKSFSTMYHNDIATNGIGARFSTVPYSYFNPTPIDNIAQVSSDGIVDDTTNWHLVSGSFIADSAYQYIIIGNFFSDMNTLHVTNDSTASIAFYYVDDVSVVLDTTDIILENAINENLEIYPNPATQRIYIKCNGMVSINMFDIFGRRLIDKKMADYIKILDVSYIATGTYILKIIRFNKIDVIKIFINNQSHENQ